MMTPAENMRRAVRFERPDWIPMEFHINPACWHHYPAGALEELVGTHPLLFPEGRAAGGISGITYDLVQRSAEPHIDPWGCEWRTTDDGITGTVVAHPLADWGAFEGYAAPDPGVSDGLEPIDWVAERARLGAARSCGDLARASLRHGHTFLRLCDLRGYERVVLDMADDEPRLWRLIGMVEEFNAAIVGRWLASGAEWMAYPEDLGMQVGPMLSPAQFRRWIAPSYARIMAPARERGVIVHMHSDGDIRLLADDLVAGGVEVINLQDLVNGIDWIADRFAGRICVELDVDRQLVTPRGAPGEIDALIREEVERIGSREGGLMMIYGLYPGVPLENARAVMDAMERYAGHHAG